MNNHEQDSTEYIMRYRYAQKPLEKIAVALLDQHAGGIFQRDCFEWIDSLIRQPEYAEPFNTLEIDDYAAHYASHLADAERHLNAAEYSAVCNLANALVSYRNAVSPNAAILADAIVHFHQLIGYAAYEAHHG